MNLFSILEINEIHFHLFKDCSVCQLGGSYTESNGYGCFEIAADKIACTCPDRRYKLNEPCRMLIVFYLC